MKRKLKTVVTGASPFKNSDESWDQYHARRAAEAKKSLQDTITVLEDYLSEDNLQKLEDAVRILDEVISIPNNITSANKILYVIKDKHGNQLSAPNSDDGELWDRVSSMEARGRRGLSVVVYVPKQQESKYKFWYEVYQNEFEPIIDEWFPDNDKIKSEVDRLYRQHKGDAAWDKAYDRWCNHGGEC